MIFIWKSMVTQCVENCTPTATVMAKRGYFSSPMDSPATAVLLSTLIVTRYSAALREALMQTIDSVLLTKAATHRQPPGRVTPRQERKRWCCPRRTLKKNLSTFLPEIYTGFLPSLSDKGPNVIFPISNPAKNRDDARFTL